MEKYTLYFYENNTIRIQKSDYIEHGFIVEIVNDIISLIEIPYGGGKEVCVAKFNTVQQAIIAGELLT
jgi:hypothetical protein